MRILRVYPIFLAALLAFPASHAFAQSYYATRQAQENYDTGIKLERQAEQLGNTKYLEDALKEYREAVSVDPDMEQAYARMGYIYYVLKRSDEGVQFLESARRRLPDGIELKHYLGLNLYQVGRVDEAEGLLKEVIASRQTLPEAYFILGKINLDRGNSKEAQEYFKQYAALSPDDAQAFRALSSAYIQMRDINGAENALTRLLKLSPDDIIASINMGHIKFERGQIDEAAAIYRKAYSQDPTRDDLLYTIASAYYLSGRYEEAIKAFSEVLKKNSNHMAAWYFTADSELKLGHLDRADELFRELEQKMPNYKYVRLKRAYIRMLRGDDSVSDDVRRLIEDTDNPDDLHFGGVMLRKDGKTEESSAIHEKLMAQHKDSIYAVYLAREYLESGRFEDAANLLKSAIAEDKQNSLAWELLSLTVINQGIDSMLLGDFDTARTQFDEALRMNIHKVNALCSLSQLALLENDTSSAYDYYQQAATISPDDPAVIKLAAQFDILDGESPKAIARLSTLTKDADSQILAGGGWYLMAIAHSNLGSWNEAAKSLEEAQKYGLADTQASAVIALELAREAVSKDNFADASAKLALVSEYKDGLDETDKVIFTYLSAITEIKNRKYSQAKSSLTAAAKAFNELPIEDRQSLIDSGRLNLSFELAYLNYETGDYEAALTQINKSDDIQKQTLEAAIRRKLAFQALKSDKASAAIDNYNRLSAIETLSPTDQYNQVLAKMQMRKLSNPEEILERYAKQNIPEAVLNYAIYLDNTGSANKALQYYQKYIAIARNKRGSDEIEGMLSTKERVWGPGNE